MKNKVAVINAYITTDKIIQNNHFPDQGRYHNVYGIDLYSSCDKVQYSVAVMDARTVNRYGAYDARRPRRKWICLCLNTRWRCPNILRLLDKTDLYFEGDKGPFCVTKQSKRTSASQFLCLFTSSHIIIITPAFEFDYIVGCKTKQCVGDVIIYLYKIVYLVRNQYRSCTQISKYISIYNNGI